MDDECPKCGCVWWRVLRRQVIQWRRLHEDEYRETAHERRACGQCGHQRNATETLDPDAPEEEPAVIEDTGPKRAIYRPPVRCLECGSASCRTTSTRRPLRYHVCGDCGHRFSSVEDGETGGE